MDINQGDELPTALVDTGDAMAMRYFSSPIVDEDPSDPFRTAGFGTQNWLELRWNNERPTRDFSPHGGRPHGCGRVDERVCHGCSGSDWLHHANIDRLWEAWLVGRPR